MYQGYASYLQAYQRHSNPYCPTNPLALNHYDKVTGSWDSLATWWLSKDMVYEWRANLIIYN